MAQAPPIMREGKPMVNEPSPISASGTKLVFTTPLVSRRGTITHGDEEQEIWPPKKQWTQEDQDATDEQKRKKAMKELVQSWMDRLQLISVITTFFSAIEAQLLGITTPAQGDTPSGILNAANAGLAGALVMHVFAAIISFLAAFFLIRYRLKEAKHEELEAEKAGGGVTTSRSMSTDSSHIVPIFSTDPHLEQVGPFSSRHMPPQHLLASCHSFCIWLSSLGFILALVGVMCFAWARMSRNVSIFASVCMGICWVGGILTVYMAGR